MNSRRTLQKIKSLHEFVNQDPRPSRGRAISRHLNSRGDGFPSFPNQSIFTPGDKKESHEWTETVSADQLTGDIEIKKCWQCDMERGKGRGQCHICGKVFHP